MAGCRQYQRLSRIMSRYILWLARFFWRRNAGTEHKALHGAPLRAAGFALTAPTHRFGRNQPTRVDHFADLFAAVRTGEFRRGIFGAAIPTPPLEGDGLPELAALALSLIHLQPITGFLCLGGAGGGLGLKIRFVSPVAPQRWHTCWIHCPRGDMRHRYEWPNHQQTQIGSCRTSTRFGGNSGPSIRTAHGVRAVVASRSRYRRGDNRGRFLARVRCAGVHARAIRP
jgi:hypothetical protein